MPNAMTDKSETIIIPLTKTKIVLLTTGAIAFLIVGFWLLSIADTQTRYDPIIVKLVTFNCFVFFGLCGIIGFRKLFDKKPGLIVDQFGITDNSSAIGGHTIKWGDITHLSIESVKRTKFILVHVKNPIDYIEESNLFKRFWLNLNNRVYGTPLSISSTALQCNISELFDILEKQRKNYVK
jgi:hypothetical protein